MASEIRIYNAAIEHDDAEFDLDVLRGTIDQNFLRLLKQDWYQRSEGFSEKEIRELAEHYFRHQKVPDIIVGMRGHRVRREGENVFWLLDPCYVIDGVQRSLAARVAIQSRPDLQLRIGVKAFFDTDDKIENDLFCEINGTQQRVSASVLVRNKYKLSRASKQLYDVTMNSDFALKDRIGWDQKLSAGQCMRGFALGSIAGALHIHKGSVANGSAYAVLDALDEVVLKIGEETFATNIIKFFDIVDTCWGIRHDKEPKCLNKTFLCVLARLFSGYDLFWDAEELRLPEKYFKRLSSFDWNAIKAHVTQVTKSNKDAKDVMFEVLRNRLKLDPFTGRRPPRDTTDGTRPTV